ncbi:transposase [Erythrobacter sp. BLCC-B19]|uniref:transposase n=1 Tax=Erythrobacter sp. BLCC-B19 TaxID=3025315 RepID=UPI003FCE13EC
MTSAFKSILWLPNRCAIRFRGQSLTGVSLDQGCLLKSASGGRIGPAYKEWDVAGPILPPEQGRGHRPAQDNCPYFEGMMWIARTGAQSRHVPDEYGKWNSVFRRYRRWGTAGVFHTMLETLAELVGRDTAADTIHRTVVRAHDCAVSKKGDSANRGAWPIARRLYYQAPRKVRCQRSPARLRTDTGAGAR